MTKRREFPAAVKKAVLKRAGSTGMLICDQCGGFARRFQIDHIIPDSHGGEPTLENAQLLCEACYAVKNPSDTTVAAKLKRVETNHLGLKRKSRGFTRPERERPAITKRCDMPSAIERQFGLEDA